MGAYAPTPLINDTLYDEVKKDIIEPTLKGMREEGNPFTGVLFIGLMVVDGKPYVLEYNVRFGDPECEVLMPLLKSPAGELFLNASTGKLKELDIKFDDRYPLVLLLQAEIIHIKVALQQR